MIIIGVDFSPGSAAAASVALEMADRLEASWRLLHVRPTTTGHESAVPEGSEDAWLELMTLGPGDVERRQGVPWIELTRAASERNVRLLAVGTHGQSGFQPLRLGRTAESLVLRSAAPVLLVSPTCAAASASAHAATPKISQERS